MEAAAASGSYQVDHWFVCFRKESGYRWLNAVPFMRFRHVRAFGFNRDAGSWVFLDAGWGKGLVMVIPDAEANEALALCTDDCTVLKVEARPHNGFLMPLLCTSLLAHMAGLPVRLTPDGLYRACLRGGATLVRCGDGADGEYGGHEPGKSPCPVIGQEAAEAAGGAYALPAARG